MDSERGRGSESGIRGESARMFNDPEDDGGVEGLDAPSSLDDASETTRTHGERTVDERRSEAPELGGGVTVRGRRGAGRGAARGAAARS